MGVELRLLVGFERDFLLCFHLSSCRFVVWHSHLESIIASFALVYANADQSEDDQSEHCDNDNENAFSCRFADWFLLCHNFSDDLCFSDLSSGLFFDVILITIRVIGIRCFSIRLYLLVFNYLGHALPNALVFLCLLSLRLLKLRD